MSAWQEVDYESIWAPFGRRFRFCPSTTKWPGFREPRDSITYHIGHVYGKPSRYERLTMDLSRKLVAALQDCVATDGFVFVLDWQHPTYRFKPSAPFDYRSEDDWPIPALPNGDYYIFVDPALEFGALGHPWEQTMCTFGKPLLESFGQNLPDLFDNPTRIDGRVI